MNNTTDDIALEHMEIMASIMNEWCELVDNQDDISKCFEICNKRYMLLENTTNDAYDSIVKTNYNFKSIDEKKVTPIFYDMSKKLSIALINMKVFEMFINKFDSFDFNMDSDELYSLKMNKYCLDYSDISNKLDECTNMLMDELNICLDCTENIVYGGGAE